MNLTPFSLIQADAASRRGLIQALGIAMRALVLSICLIIASCCATAKSLAFGTSVYQPTCSKSEWSKFEAWLIKVADARKPNDLVALAKVYLCGKGAAANRTVQRAMPKLVRFVASGSGEEDLIERRSRTEFKVKGSEFWGAQITTDGPDITVSGLVNEACAHSATFRYVEASWYLVGLGEGCD